MAFKKFKDEDAGESSVWNDAKNYVGGKIHKWLILIDDYETLAIFGYSELHSDVFLTNDNLKNTARIHALKRLIHSIKTLIRNTKFTIKSEDKEGFDKHTKRLDKIQKILPKLKLETKRGNKITELNLDENLFEKVMDDIHGMIDDINVKINKAGLIFAQFEDIDIEKMKENLEKEFTE